MIDAVKFSFGNEAIESAFAQAPKVMFRELRRSMQEIFFETRKSFLQQAPKNIRKLAKQGVFYTVWPRSKSSDRAKNLSDILGVFHATSDVPAALETGGTFNSVSGLLTVPIGFARTGSGAVKKQFKKKGGVSGLTHLISQLRGADSSKDVVTLPSKSGTGNKIVYLRKRRKARAASGIRRRRRGRKRAPAKMQAVYLLTKSVQVEPQLGLIATWNRMEFLRRQKLQRALDRTAEAIASSVRGKNALAA